MSASRITALAAALLAAASLTVGLAGQAAVAAQSRHDTHYDIIGYGYGTGSTSLAAKEAAEDSLEGDYYGCTPPLGDLVYDTEGSNGIWSAEVDANCEGLR